MRQCYYQILEVARDAEPGEIRKAYYLKSKQWHPDKNSGAGEQDTTQVFQTIQEAYAVLSDPQERAWYDNHRTEILSGTGTGGGSDSNYQEDRLDVFQYFTRSCFKEFDDGPQGFYTVFADCFQSIAREELDAADDLGDDIQSSSYPAFGSSNEDNQFQTFYQAWEAFATVKSYTWLDRYDTRAASSRAERRAMEAENQRLRSSAKRKRTDEVRSLVAYVKRRDPRVAAERLRVQEANKLARQRQTKAANQAKQRDADQLAQAWLDDQASGGLASQWTDQLEAELASIEAELDSSSPYNNDSQPPNDASAVDDDDTAYDATAAANDIQLYCVACDKQFASLGARSNHDQSKKHKKAVQLLRKTLLADEEASQKLDALLATPKINGEQSVKQSKKRRSKKDQHTPLQESSGQSSETDDSRHQTEDSITVITVESDNISDTGESEVVHVDTPVDLSPDYVVVDDVDEQVKSSTKSVNPSKSSSTAPTASSSTNKCSICQAEFPGGRNQLFAHLKATGHYAPKPVLASKTTTATNGDKQRGRKGRRR